MQISWLSARQPSLSSKSRLHRAAVLPQDVAKRGGSRTTSGTTAIRVTRGGRVFTVRRIKRAGRPADDANQSAPLGIAAALGAGLRDWRETSAAVVDRCRRTATFGLMF